MIQDLKELKRLAMQMLGETAVGTDGTARINILRQSAWHAVVTEEEQETSETGVEGARATVIGNEKISKGTSPYHLGPCGLV